MRRARDAHHVVHWARDGPTELSSVTMLCKWHLVLVRGRAIRWRPCLRGAFGSEICRAGRRGG